ncbi:MAG TPA: hypothetical protein VF630_13325 [Hymenobacter sp.]|jgi:hypothetical protein
MSYNPGGWDEDKMKYYGLALVVAVVARGIYCWLTGTPIGPE